MASLLAHAVHVYIFLVADDEDTRGLFGSGEGHSRLLDLQVQLDSVDGEITTTNVREQMEEITDTVRVMAD